MYSSLVRTFSRAFRVDKRSGTRLVHQNAKKESNEDPLDPSIPIIDEKLSHPDLFDLRNCFTVREMFDARIHLGHKEGTLNDLMKPLIVGSRLGSCIIDLEQTRQLLGDALNFTAHVASRGGIILLVNRNRQVCLII